MMTIMEYDLKHGCEPYLTIQEFASVHREHSIVLKDDDSMIAESLSMSAVERRAGRRAIVEYLGLWDDSDNLHFVVITEENEIDEADQFEILVVPY
jgi:hypothetical protein